MGVTARSNPGGLGEIWSDTYGSPLVWARVDVMVNTQSELTDLVICVKKNSVRGFLVDGRLGCKVSRYPNHHDLRLDFRLLRRRFRFSSGGKALIMLFCSFSDA